MLVREENWSCLRREKSFFITVVKPWELSRPSLLCCTQVVAWFLDRDHNCLLSMRSRLFDVEAWLAVPNSNTRKPISLGESYVSAVTTGTVFVLGNNASSEWN